MAAIEIEDLRGEISEDISQSSEEILKSNAELNAKISQLDQRLGEIVTKDDVTQLLQAHLEITNQVMDNFRSWLIVSFIISGLCICGLFYSIYFYFKGQGRI